MDVTLSNLRPYASTVTAGIHAVAGAVLGAGLQSKLRAGPPADQFISALQAVCPVLDSGHPNLRLCEQASFEALKPLFGDYVALQIILGALLIPSGGIIGFTPLLLKLLNKCLNQNNQEGKTNRFINFIDEVAYPLRNIIFGIGGAFLGNGIQAFSDQTLPPLQQTLNAGCTSYGGSNTTLLCNTDLFKLLSGVLFPQPSSTTLVIGSTLMGIMAVGSFGYGIFRCVTNRNGSAVNEGVDDEFQLQNRQANEPPNEIAHLLPRNNPNPLHIEVNAI